MFLRYIFIVTLIVAGLFTLTLLYVDRVYGNHMNELREQEYNNTYGLSKRFYFERGPTIISYAGGPEVLKPFRWNPYVKRIAMADSFYIKKEDKKPI